jgi:hypothetical protein
MAASYPTISPFGSSNPPSLTTRLHFTDAFPTASEHTTSHSSQQQPCTCEILAYFVCCGSLPASCLLEEARQASDDEWPLGPERGIRPPHYEMVWRLIGRHAPGSTPPGGAGLRPATSHHARASPARACPRSSKCRAGNRRACTSPSWCPGSSSPSPRWRRGTRRSGGPRNRP